MQNTFKKNSKETKKSEEENNNKVNSSEQIYNKNNDTMDKISVKDKLQQIKDAIRKEFGKESVFTIEEQRDFHEEVISTGSIRIDQVIGNGGFVKGRIVEIYGPESSGKTTLSLHVIKSAQEQGGIGAFIDVEHAIDLAYAEKIGVKTDELLISQPGSGEEALELLSRYIDQKVDVIVLDSVAALVTKAEIQGDMGDAHIGLQARLMSQGLKKILSKAAANNTLIIFLNQLRSKIGVMFGNPETTTGGNALKFYASVRLDIRRGENIKSVVTVDQFSGNKMRVKCVKNKCAAPFMKTEVTINYNEGIGTLDEIIALGVEQNIIQKSGSWYAIGDQKLGQGVENVVQFLRDKPEMVKSIKNQILEKLNIAVPESKIIDHKKIKERLEEIKVVVRKEFGKESVFTTDDKWNKELETVSTGSIKIDEIVGNGGLQKGRIVEIFGPESSGKTTLCLHIIKSVQEKGGTAAFIDMEHALDMKYAEKLGVKGSDLLLSQPNSGEDALSLMNLFIENKVDVVILDSVAALVTKAEIEGDMGDAHVGLQARLMSQALRKLSPKAGKNNTLVIFTNQLRSKIGVMFGSPETTTGGNALKFFASIRLDVRRIENIKGKDEEIIGSKTRVKCVKNKTFPPSREAIITINYNEGINFIEEILSLAVDHNIISKSGTWYAFGDIKLGQGTETAIDFLKANISIKEDIYKRLMSKLKME